ncbi:MAG: ABC transporter ATP-binding protein [Patescibacteria group bacterium]
MSHTNSTGNVLIKADKIFQSFSMDKDETIDVLKDVSFVMKYGSFNIIYGPSGSGKSTLLNVLTGLQKPTQGEITFDDQNVYDLKPDELAHFRANRIGIVYQQNYWVKSLTVIDNVAMPLYFLGYSRKEAHAQAIKALERVGMEGYTKKYPTRLSGGEQQRVAMARALVNDPLFIIADEPTGSLDSKNGDMIMGLLKRANKEQGRTIILVTHNMEYLPLANHLLHIQDGQVKELQGQNIHEETMGLMRDMKKRIDQLSRDKTGDEK